MPSIALFPFTFGDLHKLSEPHQQAMFAAFLNQLSTSSLTNQTYSFLMNRFRMRIKVVSFENNCANLVDT